MTDALEMRVGNTSYDITPFVDHFVWSDSMIRGGFSWRMRFRADRWTDWRELLFDLNKPTIQFRVVTDAAGRGVSSEWRTALTDGSRCSFAQDKSMVAEVVGADLRLELAQQARTRMWSDVEASVILRAIAGEYGLNTNIQDTRAGETWYQLRKSDWAFARDIAAVANESSRGDTYLWLDENILHYGAPRVEDAALRRFDMDMQESRVDRYATAYMGRSADRLGAATFRGVGFDFATKKALSFVCDQAAAASHPALAARVPRSMADGLRVVPVFEDDRARIEEATRWMWGRVAARYLSVSIATNADPTIKPNTMLELDSDLDDTRTTPFMGRYACLEVTHVLDAGAIRTIVTGWRREAQSGEDEPSGASVAAVSQQSNLSTGRVTVTAVQL